MGFGGAAPVYAQLAASRYSHRVVGCYARPLGDNGGELPSADIMAQRLSQPTSNILIACDRSASMLIPDWMQELPLWLQAIVEPLFIAFLMFIVVYVMGFAGDFLDGQSERDRN